MRAILICLAMLLAACNTDATVSWQDCTELPCTVLIDKVVLKGVRRLKVDIKHPDESRVHTVVEAPGHFDSGHGDISFDFDTTKLRDGDYTLKASARLNRPFAPSFLDVTIDNCSLMDLDIDGVDQDCDGVDGRDADRDGLVSRATGGTDCDDLLPTVGECDLPAGDSQDYEPSNTATVFTKLVVETDPNVGRDLDGDGNPDNVMGSTFNDLFAFLDVDLEDYLEEQTQAGRFSTGMLWSNEDSPVQGILVGFVPVMNEDVGLNGHLITHDSFFDGTASPMSVFDDITVNEDGSFRAAAPLVVISFPFGSSRLRLVFEGVVLTGQLEQTDVGLALRDGEMFGTSPLEAVIGALETYLHSEPCKCLGLKGPMFNLSFGAGPQACVGQYDRRRCSGTGEEQVCSTIANACIFIVPVLSGQTDSDTTGEGEPDSFSFLIRLEGEPTQIYGVAPP